MKSVWRCGTGDALLVLVGVVPAFGGGDVPEALRRAQDARAKAVINTARLEYSVLHVNPDKPENTHTRFFTWRCAGDEILNTNWGAEDGVVLRGADGAAAQVTYNGPVSSLLKDGEIWQHIDRSPRGAVMEGTRADSAVLLDWRTIGLNPVQYYMDFDKMLQKVGLPPPDYSTDVQEGLYVISGITGKAMSRWWIDPSKDWAVVKTAVFQDGTQIGEMRYRYKEFDGYWFPETVERIRLAAGESEPAEVLHVLHAEFNRPEHPSQLQQSDAGFEVGTNIDFQDRVPRILQVWDGEKAVSSDEFFARLERGELTLGPVRTRELARRRAAAARDRTAAEGAVAQPTTGPSATSKPAVPAFETAWEVYTRRFIKIFNLDTDQQQKAWLVCQECQERGRHYVDTRSSALAELVKQRSEVKDDGTPDYPQRVQQLDEREKSLLDPLDRIFREQLKPRLFKLPTRAQTEAAKDLAVGEFKPPT